MLFLSGSLLTILQLLILMCYRDRKDLYVEARSVPPCDTVMRIYTSRNQAREVARQASKRIRRIHADASNRTYTASLLGVPSTQIVLGPGFECLNVLLPGMLVVCWLFLLILFKVNFLGLDWRMYQLKQPKLMWKRFLHLLAKFE